MSVVGTQLKEKTHIKQKNKQTKSLMKIFFLLILKTQIIKMQRREEEKDAELRQGHCCSSTTQGNNNLLTSANQCEVFYCAPKLKSVFANE